jgi:peptidoglycan hydrolase-like protein with peptidoglycan-binding domain
MSPRLLWMTEVLRAAGLKVSEVDGWRDRGRDAMGRILGVVCHYTGTVSDQNMPTLRTLVVGRTDLPGPLSQLGLGRDGTYYVIASGRANHAGRGTWNGIDGGNTHFIGIEAENSGRRGDTWPAVQLDAYQRGVAAILAHAGRTAASCCGHREYARPAGRKPDPGFDMDVFRTAVAGLLSGSVVTPPPIPRAEPGESGRPTLRRGDIGEHVAVLQRKLGIEPPGPFGPTTEAAVRRFQRARGMIPDGIVGPKSWAALDAL